MRSETFTLHGKRYRLIPPGTYRSKRHWWVDWRDDVGRRRRCSSWTGDFDEAKRFAYNIASGMGWRDARSQNGYVPAPAGVAREIARSDAEAELIRAWLPPSRTAAPVEIIAGTLAGMTSDEAIRLLRRTIRRIKEDATLQRIKDTWRREEESGDKSGAIYRGLVAENAVSALAAGSMTDQKIQANQTS